MLTLVLGVSACTNGGSGTGPTGPVPPSSASITEYPVADAGQKSNPMFLTVGPDRNMWFTEFDTKSVGTIDLTSHAVTHYPLPATGTNPTRIAMGPDGQLWFAETGPADGDPADSNATNIAEISPSGAINEIQLPISDSDPTGIVLGTDGNIWFTEAATGDLRKYTVGKGLSDPTNLSDANGMPTGVTNGPDANLWTVENSADKISKLTLDGGLTEFPLLSGTGAVDIALGHDGNLWFTESLKNAIGRITTDGTISSFPTVTDASVPTGIVMGPDCNMWFTESNANLIGRIDATGHITEFKIPTANSEPTGIALGPDGNLWFAESAVNQIAMLTPPPGSSTDCSEVDLPPVAKCQDTKVNTDTGTCTAASASIDNGTMDPQGLALTQSSSPEGPYSKGKTVVTLTARRSSLIASACAANLEVDDAEAPQITCPPQVVAECTSPAGASATVTATATDNCSGVGTPTCTGSGGIFAIGTTGVTCNVTDASNNPNSCVTSVIVRDTTPPTITSITASPSMIWPPDGRRVPISVSVAATDTCDANVSSRCKIVSIKSNQTTRQGCFQITGQRSAILTAERLGSGDRSYTVQVQCTDASGNSTTASATVTVPHDQRGHDHDDHDGDNHGHDDDHYRR